MNLKLLFASGFLIFLTSFSLKSQETNAVSSLVIKPVLAFQLWGTYTMGQELYEADIDRYRSVDDRLNFLLHRSRAGIKGSWGSNWVYDFTTSLDFVGQDVLSGTVGGTNNGPSPRLRIWNAVVQNKVSSNNDLLYLTFGYTAAQLSRESVTSPFAVGSFEKSWSQNYIRRHSAGTGPGRIVGINFGGLYAEKKNFAINYDLGIYNPQYTDFNGNSAGTLANPLWTYRVGLHFGDPEFTKYSRGHKFNYKGERNGITIALSGSYQADNNIWDNNSTIGFDVLANFNNFNLSGEWMQLDRDFGGTETSSNTGYIKLGYYQKLKDGRELEPVITYMFFNGPTDFQEQQAALLMSAFSGKENYIEATLNYYLTNKIKLSISYTLRDGDNGEIPANLVQNNYFQQGGVGAIRKGDYFGFGLSFSI